MEETIISRFRLCSSAFSRNDDDNKIDPKRMIILSVEGDDTERDYFNHLNDYLDSSLVRIEILRHRQGEGYSDPRQVIDLLNEYMNIREGEVLPINLPKAFIEKYSREDIHKYLSNDPELTYENRKSFQEDLLIIGIDLEYRKYLKQFDKDEDYFGIVLDRDCINHSRELMEDCIRICKEKGYGCFVTNPCFEFWLLLHLCDVKMEFSHDDLIKLYENPKISNRHTATSREVSKRAHHRKHINAKTFVQYYYPNISQAIINSKCFEKDFPDLLDNLGSNIPELLTILGID